MAVADRIAEEISAPRATLASRRQLATIRRMAKIGSERKRATGADCRGLCVETRYVREATDAPVAHASDRANPLPRLRGRVGVGSLGRLTTHLAVTWSESLSPTLGRCERSAVWMVRGAAAHGRPLAAAARDRARRPARLH